MRKIVVITSGGLDSAVLLHHHFDMGDSVRALAINYGQRHARELYFASAQAVSLNVPFEAAMLADLRRILPGSSQTSSDVPVPSGHYAEKSMKATVVPNRNMILLAVAIGHAIAHGCDSVSYAAHAGDHAIYPDCRPEFAEAMDKVAKLCDWQEVDLLRPFINLTKAEIVSLGRRLEVNFSDTYSCYRGQAQHCGRCGTCTERREAFQLAGVPDPTDYAPDAPLLDQMLPTK